jgi:hypothetical protein
LNDRDILTGLLKLGEVYRLLLKCIDPRFLSSDGLSILTDHLEIPFECIWPGIFGYVIHQPFDARITPDIPDIFEKFRGKRFSHLWCLGRHGFGAGGFPHRCEGHANTGTSMASLRLNWSRGNAMGRMERRTTVENPNRARNLLF